MWGIWGVVWVAGGCGWYECRRAGLSSYKLSTRVWVWASLVCEVSTRVRCGYGVKARIWLVRIGCDRKPVMPRSLWHNRFSYSKLA